jgi:chemotaxis protein CheD
MGGSPTIGSVFAQRIVVGVGDMAVSNNTNMIISTYALGSCVGVVVYDPFVSVGGILHVMLPDSTLSPDKAAMQPSMFADTGWRVFWQSLVSLRAEKRRVKVVIAGGASVLSQSDMFKIGERNAAAIKRILQEEGIPTFAEELGGLNNRTLHLQLKTGTVEIKYPTGTKQLELKEPHES